MVEVSSKLGPALHLGESLVWQNQPVQQPAPTSSVQPSVPNTEPTPTQAPAQAALPQAALPKAALPQQLPPPVLQSKKGGALPPIQGGALPPISHSSGPAGLSPRQQVAPLGDLPPSYEEALIGGAILPDPPSQDPSLTDDVLAAPDPPSYEPGSEQTIPKTRELAPAT